MEIPSDVSAHSVAVSRGIAKRAIWLLLAGVLALAAGEAYGSISVHVRQVFERCCASLPWNHAGVGGSFTQG